jgi:hypothetical protein
MIICGHNLRSEGPFPLVDKMHSDAVDLGEPMIERVRVVDL